MKKYTYLFVAVVVLSLIWAQGAFAQWTDPAPLNTNAATDSEDDRSPRPSQGLSY